MKHFYSIACRFGLIGVLVFGLQVSVFPQTYQLTSVSGTFTPLIEGTNVASTQTDDGISDTIDIGFDFVFYGVSYSQLIACSNGYISFNLSAGSDFNNTISSGDASLRPLIAPFWADLNGDLGTSAYKLEGSAPNRTFTFEWLNFKWDYEATEPGISFQVLLHETTNVIEFIYKQESGGINNGIASIGLSISTVEPSDPIFYSLNDAGTNPSLSSTVATDNISTKPATGQVYRFTQQTLPEPTNHATAFAASTNHTYITLSWTDAAGSQLPDGYLIIASDANNIIDPVDLIDIVPDNDIGDGSAIVKVSQGKQTYSDFSNLQYNATYYFKIYSFTNSGTLIDYKTLPAAPETLLSYTPFPEPTNHVTSFSALRGYSTITLNWTDAIGSQLPNGYLIIVSNADNIVDPIDLTDIVPDSNLNDGIAKVKVNQGIQTYSGFTNLQFNNTYYFKIYPFTNSGNNIDYKKVPAAPQTLMEFNQKSEPSNHVTSFKAQSSGSNITLNWIDATGIIIPDYYAILISKTNFPANPIDGTEPVEDNDLSDGTGLVKVAHGVQSYSGLLNLELLNTYYFKIIPYTNYGSAINYKTDGIVPQTLVYFQSGELANNILCFDGINDNVDCGQLNPTIFSVEAWVNPTILNIDQAILSTLNETGINAGFELHLNSVGKPAFTIRNSGSWVDVVASNAVIANTWTHLAVIFDGIIVKLYVNGVMVNSGSASSFTAGNNALKLGIRSVNGSCQYFKGNIDEVSVWTKALSEPEIQLNMFSKLLGNESDLLVYYNFDQGTGFADNTKVKALNDATSNAIHGTLTGFALTGTTSNWISKNIESSTNNCLSFDGTDDYIAIPVLGSSLTQLTIETWVNLSSATTSGGVFNTNVWNTGSIHFQIWNGTSIEFAVGSNSSTTTTSYTFSADTWYHLAATYNSSTKQVCIYVNGLLIKSETIATTNAVNLTAAQIGAWNNAGTNQRIFSGKMDEYRIWNSVRTQTEIADNMLKSISNPSSVSNLIAYYKMDQGTASGNNFGNISLIDGSAGNMNGALTNFELTGSSSNWLLFDNYSKRIASCNYIFTPVSGTFTSLIGGTQLTNTVSDAISLGFSFNFNGTNYTQAYACMYGWLSFNATKPTSTYENDVVTSNLAALPFLAPLWDFYQNYGAPVSIRYKTEGTTPNKVFTTEWTEMGGLYSTAAQITFQVKLYETTNRIEYIYKQEPQELGYNSATIGYFFADNSYLTLNNTSSTPNVVSNLNYYDQRTKPATGQIYRFEPDVLDEPTSYPTELSTSLENGWLTLNWKDAAGLQIPDGYLILASKDNTFSTPIDNTNLSDDLDLLDGYGRVKVNQGKQTFSGWKHLESSETWYFRLYPFTNSGSSINYKTTNPVAQIRVSYPYYLFTEHNNIFYYEGNSFVTDYQYLTESEAIIGDFNKDGNLDVFVGGDPGGNIVDFNTVYLNDGTGYFTTNAAFTHFEYESMSMTDVDNDSDLDFLITATIGSSYYTVLYTDYNLHENLFRNVKGGASAWADYDNDGDQDLLLTGNTGEGLISKIYRNNGNLGFTEQSAIIIPGIEYGSVAWTDYDKDGYKDFLISGSGITQIYRNTGKENFVEQTIIQLTGLSNSSVAWGDYDNDGYPDILMAGSGVTKIYHNNGDNTFTELLNTGLAGFSSGKVNWGDYDNDGDLDILLSCTNITKLYTNNYPINTFTEDTEVAFYGVENGTTLFADYDRDNDLDVLMPSIQKEYCNNNKIVNTAPSLPDGLISSTKANGLLLKWNKSTDNTTPSDAITYNIKVGTASGLENIVAPMSLSNGTRLVSDRGNMGSDTSVLLIIPKGTYYWSIQAIDNSIVSSAFSAEQPYAMDFVQAADLNASVLTSNSLMLRWTNGNGNSRIVFCKEGNEGTASPVDATTYASDALFGKGDQIGSTGWYCIYSGKADSAIVSGLSIDKSYIFQIIEYTYPSGSPIYYTITGNANPGVFGVNSFLEQKNIVLEELCSGSAIWGDYDNDGFLDFLISGNAYNGTSEHIYEKYLTKIYRNNGNNTFTNTINLLGLNYASAAWGDYDNDGDLDLIITGTTESFVTATKLYRNESGSFVEQAISLPGTSEGSLAWGDYNNDGMLDFIITGSLNSKIYKNIGNNSFEEQTSISLPQVTESEVTWGDMNNDGYLDLVLSGKNSSGAFAKIFINNKNNSFSELVGTPFINAAEGAVALGDYDKDGFMDIFVSGYTCWVCGDPNAKLYHNNGDGSFSEFTGNSFNGIELGTAQWGDYDNDSDLDILITGDRTGSGSISTTIYKNNFPINTFTPIKPIVELGHSAASWGDYDNDGDLDIVIIG
ncbi:MAG: FG-GAP-like repeat-containing protein, partial [Salinivirgaceae bacterium]